VALSTRTRPRWTAGTRPHGNSSALRFTLKETS
jgi:hypothetical protein